ncbi:hypothetical protein DQ384_39355 [Sphaerisporangium album]|uniref:Uncharacterized protein n=1 Tax=Sphaerisporangium album TaxID=509200 RepID=A0A367EIK3_9ACTN|nr:hypothetical protein [Sphaerisporangium album]RCG17904.1 hypothetical protein DQ384_39355 [Sphaerisporangium album]
MAETPRRASYEVRLNRGLQLGVLWISAQKGRALRIEITWQPTDHTRKAEGAQAITALLNTLPVEG